MYFTENIGDRLRGCVNTLTAPAAIECNLWSIGVFDAALATSEVIVQLLTLTPCTLSIILTMFATTFYNWSHLAMLALGMIAVSVCEPLELEPPCAMDESQVSTDSIRLFL